MSACFVSWLVEMPKDAKPDWAAAKAYIAKVDKSHVDKLRDDGPEYYDEMYDASELRDEALQHLATLEEYWDEHTVELSNTYIVLFAGMSYGDSVHDGCDAIQFLDAIEALKPLGVINAQ